MFYFCKKKINTHREIKMCDTVFWMLVSNGMKKSKKKLQQEEII